jgi:rare lipoprotein A
MVKIASFVTAIFVCLPLSSNISHSRPYDGSFIKASFYSSGSRTASGEPFNPHGYTAASRTLPFGTRLHVTNPTTGRCVIVRINDRGPFVRDRDLDLSRGAAAAIGMIAQGTAMLKVVRLSNSGSANL